MQRITNFERQIIEVGVRTGKSHRKIAESINRDRRVIDREIKRNSGGTILYTATTAQRLAEERQEQKNKLKLEKEEYAQLRAFVIERLQKDHSPEQIAGILKKHPPEELCGKTVSHESIYQYIYEGEGRYEDLFKHLRKGKKKRQKRYARKQQNTPISERISIHERPETVEEKKRYGDWESDTMEGKKSDTECLSVQYERKAQLLRLHRILNKTAEETEQAIYSTIDSFPLYLFHTMTFDNGSEGARHMFLRDDFNIETYHCDPYSAWQKGGVENVIGLVRQYIPKGYPISELTDDQIYDIQEKINNRPRKSLNYLTPNQVIAQEIGEGGAL